MIISFGFGFQPIGTKTILKKLEMTNKEQIQKNIEITFDLIAQIIETPEILDKIPDGITVNFLDSENVKLEKHSPRDTKNIYVKVKRRFEVL